MFFRRHIGKKPETAVKISGRSLAEMVADYERAIIEEAMKIAEGNQSAAARMLKVSRPALISKLKKYKLWKY